ncbi:hypothetical protein X777_01098, partial [Ooceraea biroi]
IKLLREIMLKKAVINVHSMDNACFAWSVVALEKKKEEEKLTAVPIRLTDEKKTKYVNLLYMQDPQDNGLGHFACIKNLSRLVSSQLSKKNGQKYICDRCLHYFYTNEKLEAHTADCQRMNNCAIVLPNEDNKWLQFTNYNRKERMPFVIYVDLECILQKMTDNPKLYQRHQVCSIGYYVQCSYNQIITRVPIPSRPDVYTVALIARNLVLYMYLASRRYRVA